LLVAIGVMSILLSLLLPALSKARLAAHELVCMTHIRDMGNLLTAYAAEYDDRFPSALGDGEEIRNDFTMWDNYTFQVLSTFPREPWLSWSGLDEHSETLYCPASQEADELPRGVCDPDYVLSASVFAESRYFDPDLPEAVWRSRLGAKVQRHGAAVFPDRKVGILEHRVWHGWPGSACIGCSVDYQFYYDSPRPGSLWFLDGHTDQIHAADALPYVNRWPIWPLMPFGTTEWGIAGRDIE
jgi:type II secretory pathway pseudopilin PulG